MSKNYYEENGGGLPHFVRTAKFSYIAVSAALCLLGILLVCLPEISLNLIGILCGALLIGFGAVRIIGYFSNDIYRLAFQFDLSAGILLIALGIIMIARPSWLMSFICIAFGIYVFGDGLFKLQIALDARTFGLPRWWLVLALALINSALGLVLIFRPGDGGVFLTVFLGLNLISDGLLNIITALTSVKVTGKSKKSEPEAIEVEFKDRSKY